MASETSCGLDSGLDTDCGAGVARRGSLRCLSRASAGAETGFFSAGSVAVASADSELMLTARGDAAGVALDAAAAGAAGTGVETTGVGGGVATVAAGGAGAGGRGSGTGAAATGAEGAGAATGVGGTEAVAAAGA